MQSLYKCVHYRRNENMNKTCTFKIEHMCKIFYGEFCDDYKEKKEQACLGIDCITCNVKDCEVVKNGK